MKYLKYVWRIALIVAVIFLGYSLIQDSDDFNWSNYNYEYETADNKAIKLGFIGALTNTGTAIGEQSLISVELAVDEINRNGGINGKAVRLLIEDGECSEAAEAAAQRLIDQGVVAIVGGMCSSESLSIIDLIDTHRIPTISYCSSSPELSGASRYFFRIFPSDIFQADYAAHYLNDQVGAKNVAIAYSDSGWGRGLSREFERSFKELGGTISLNYPFSEDDTDYSELWSNIERINPDVVYFISPDKGTTRAFGQIDDFNIQSDFFGADAWLDPEMWKKMDTQGKNFLYTVPIIKQDTDFLNKMKSRGIHELSNCYVQAYDAVNIFEQVIESGSLDPEDIVEGLQNLSYTGSVSSFNPIEFNSDGDIVSVDYEIKKPPISNEASLGN